MDALPLRVTTLNLWRFYEWERRFPLIVEYLLSMQPDVIMLQEVQLDWRHSSYNQVALLQEKLAIPFSSFAVTRLKDSQRGQPVDPPIQHGQGILSRWPLVHQETLILRRAEDDPEVRTIMHADLRRDDELHLLANIHVSNRDDWAEAHLREYFALLAMRGEQRILAGDFNHPELERFSEAWSPQYVSSLAISPYVSAPAPTGEKTQAYDYVLAPQHYEFLGVHTSDGCLSDHLAVSADLRLRSTAKKS